ncbi:MAG: methyltransferase domain-containing protein [Patescibacteria group bacterium]
MFSDPRHNIEQLGLSDGAIVADFGAGSGFYSLEAGLAVAPTGKVYAIDAQKELLERLKKEAKEHHIKNIEIIAGDLEKLGGSKLREGSCDVVIASNILFMIGDKKNFLLEACRVLKAKGRLLIIDWAASFSQMGPHPTHVFYKDDALKLARETGFAFDREIHTGAHHYGIIFRKQ